MNFMRIATDLEVEPLLVRLAQHPDLWKQGPRETYLGSAHREAHSINIRWVQSAESVEAVLNSTEAVDQPAAKNLMPEIGEAVMSVLERVGVIGKLGHVLLTKLAPGAKIAPHVDEGAYSELYDRFHVCLQGGVGNSFRCGGEVFYPAPGEIFWFNHKREHSVQYFGVEGEPTPDRIHLIVDVMAPDYTRLRGLYYQAETDVLPVIEEAAPLLELHKAELAHYPDIQLEVDVKAYAALQAAGQLRCYTARDCGRLVGYALFFVRPNHHYRGSLQAWQDVLYLHQDYRRGRVGITLIRVAETRLRAEGVQVVYHHAKRTNKTGELLGCMGYELVDEIWAKRLDVAEKMKRR